MTTGELLMKATALEQVREARYKQRKLFNYYITTNVENDQCGWILVHTSKSISTPTNKVTIGPPKKLFKLHKIKSKKSKTDIKTLNFWKLFGNRAPVITNINVH